MYCVAIAYRVGIVVGFLREKMDATWASSVLEGEQHLARGLLLYLHLPTACFCVFAWLRCLVASLIAEKKKKQKQKHRKCLFLSRIPLLPMHNFWCSAWEPDPASHQHAWGCGSAVRTWLPWCARGCSWKTSTWGFGLVAGLCIKLNIFISLVCFGRHLCFRKQNFCWRLPASAGGVSPGRDRKLSTCSRTGTKSTRGGFPGFAAFLTELSGVHSWLSSGCIVSLRGRNNFLPLF